MTNFAELTATSGIPGHWTDTLAVSNEEFSWENNLLDCKRQA